MKILGVADNDSWRAVRVKEKRSKLNWKSKFNFVSLDLVFVNNLDFILILR